MTLSLLMLLWSTLSAAGLGASGWMVVRTWAEARREHRAWPPVAAAAAPLADGG
ncbi:hypothetical protein [Ramlibacter sp. Leaf400]|uniref:hypothetical protein n=1 Tax=Ramlibacter sp. Leaf400 TaxID=1736365 RepID=UPI0012E3EC94|nr:hypothetical protein [Ramlibacter sp. Leaf400]